MAFKQREQIHQCNNLPRFNSRICRQRLSKRHCIQCRGTKRVLICLLCTLPPLEWQISEINRLVFTVNVTTGTW